MAFLSMTTKVKGEIPLDLMKQDPSTGMYKFGGIEMTGGEYAIALAFNSMTKDFEKLSERMETLEKK